MDSGALRTRQRLFAGLSSLLSLLVMLVALMSLTSTVSAQTSTDSPLQFDPTKHCGLVVASRQTIPEITAILDDEIAPRQTMQLYQSQNGWYALLYQVVDISMSESLTTALIAGEIIPDDAFCSSGRLFTRYIEQAEYFPAGALAEQNATHATHADSTQSGDVLQFDPATECGLVLSSHDSLDKVSTYLHEEYAAEKTMQLYRSENGWYAIILGVVPDTVADNALAMGKAEGLLMEDSFCSKGTKYVEFIEQKDYFPASARGLLATETQPATNNTDDANNDAQPETAVETVVPLTIDNPDVLQPIIEWAIGLELPETVVPRDPTALFALTALDLQGFAIEALPSAIGELRNLENLNVYDNQLSVIPDSIGNLTRLTVLDVGRNQLISLPESLGSLSALQRLNANDNQLITLPLSISQLDQLRYLALSNNELWEIPASLRALEQLRGLYVSGNPIQAMPTWLDTLPNLTEIIQ